MVVRWRSLPFFACVCLAMSGSAAASDLTFQLGVAIVNNFDSEDEPAWSIDYHHTLGPRIDWNVAYINEGHPPGLRRDGLASEIFGYRRFYDDRLVLALGAGLYGFANTRMAPNGHENEHGMAGLVTFTFHRRLTEKVFLRGTWHRVVTNNDTDTDVLLVGLGLHLGNPATPPP